MDLSLLLAIGLLVALYFWFRRRQGYRRPGGYRLNTPEPGVAPHRSVSGHTQRELLRLVGGNHAVAARLVEQVKLRNPSHSEQWCWEKAIYDIQRDRHSN